MNYTPKRLTALLGAGLSLWHISVANAADATGWDCQKTTSGVWKCEASNSLPASKPAAPVPLSTEPVTPPAASLPVKPKSETEIEPPLASPEPAPEPVPEPEATIGPPLAPPEPPSETVAEPEESRPAVTIKPEPEAAIEPPLASPEPPSEPVAEPEESRPAVTIKPEPEAAIEPPLASPEPPSETVAEPEESRPAVATKPEPETEPQVASPKPLPEPEPAPGAAPEYEEPVAKPLTEAEKPAVVIKPEPAAEPDAIPAPQPAGISAESQDEWALCPVEPRPARIAVAEGSRANTQISLTADEADVSKLGVSQFRGNVDIRRADQRLRADSVDYDRDQELMTAKGNVILSDNGIEISGATARLDLNKDEGIIEQASFKLYSRHARGTADTLRRDNVAQLTKLDKATYTTCPTGNTDWELNADKIKLDQANGVGTARNVSVWFKGIPLFYSPWMTFPIDDRRKSGILTPTFGSTNESGTEIVIPYYWNIAPNRDATITPRILSKRGLQLGGEYRYLTAISEGTVNAEFLPDDDKFNDDRYLFAFKGKTRFTPRLRTDANITYVSDNDYFEDLGTDISLTSQTHLERRLDVTYSGSFWSVLGRVQGYDTIDDTIASNGRPYERLPQLLFNLNLPDQHFGLDYGLRAEAVHFNRDNSATGTRFDINPSISLPLRNSYGYITPKIGLRHTRYELDNTLATRDDSPTRTLPIFSIDSGLLFERDMSFGGQDFIQTLEPRLFYLNVPNKNQDNTIVDESGQDVVFDSGLFDFSFAQLFRENRFTGADRVGDANQLTAAITTRILDPNTGIERLQASIGQIFYFRDREVTLPGSIEEETNSSDIVAEISARISRTFSAKVGIQYDTHENETDKGVFSLRYQPDAKRIINLAYRQRTDLLEQIDLSASWPINQQWNIVGRWDYALDRERTIDAFAGLEYESCCWIARIVARQFINDLDQRDENFVLMLQLELKGLTGFGNKIKTFLGDGILGYGRDPDDNPF